MTVSKRVPEEQYFINTICVAARCVFVWLSPGMAAQVGNDTAPSSAGTALGAARGWLPGPGSALGQGAQAGAAKLAWLGRRLHDPSRAMDLSPPSAALMGSAGSEQSKANEVGNKIKNGEITARDWGRHPAASCRAGSPTPRHHKLLLLLLLVAACIPACIHACISACIHAWLVRRVPCAAQSQSGMSLPVSFLWMPPTRSEKLLIPADPCLLNIFLLLPLL